MVSYKFKWVEWGNEPVGLSSGVPVGTHLAQKKNILLFWIHFPIIKVLTLIPSWLIQKISLSTTKEIKTVPRPKKILEYFIFFELEFILE